MAKQRFVQVPVEILKSLISMAQSHVEDINTGIDDGTYVASENIDIGKKEADIASAEQYLLDGLRQEPCGFWDCNDVQFPRLIAEINATQDGLDFDALAASMDLSVEDVESLFDRADQAWELIKGNGGDEAILNTERARA